MKINYYVKRWRELKAKWYKKLRMSVFFRDDFTCQLCGKKGGRLNAHHIIKYCKSKKLRFNKDNLITLCEKCHEKINGKEDDYIDFFKAKVKEKDE